MASKIDDVGPGFSSQGGSLVAYHGFFLTVTHTLAQASDVCDNILDAFLVFQSKTVDLYSCLLDEVHKGIPLFGVFTLWNSHVRL